MVISGDFPAQTRIYERTVDDKKDVQIGVYKDDDGHNVKYFYKGSEVPKASIKATIDNTRVKE